MYLFLKESYKLQSFDHSVYLFLGWPLVIRSPETDVNTMCKCGPDVLPLASLLRFAVVSCENISLWETQMSKKLFK